MAEDLIESVLPLQTRREQLLPLHSCIRIFRRQVDGDEAWISGIVLDVSHKLLLLQVISEQITLNGYRIIRRRDISHIERPAPRQEFILKALRLRNQQPGHPGALKLDNMAAAISCISRLTPLMTVYQEISDPSLCWVGKPDKVSDDLLYMRSITPEAQLEAKADIYDIENITRIDFGSAYEDALWQVHSSS